MNEDFQYMDGSSKGSNVAQCAPHVAQVGHRSHSHHHVYFLIQFRMIIHADEKYGSACITLKNSVTRKALGVNINELYTH